MNEHVEIFLNESGSYELRVAGIPVKLSAVEVVQNLDVRGGKAIVTATFFAQIVRDPK